LEPRRLLPPVEQKSHHTIEKNWTPLIYSDSIHMMTSLNPVVVVKLPDADTWGDDIVTEFVSRDTEEVRLCECRLYPQLTSPQLQPYA